MGQLFLKHGDVLEGGSNQKGEKKCGKSKRASVPQPSRVENIGSQPLPSFYLIPFQGSVSLIKFYIPFFSICRNINQSDF